MASIVIRSLICTLVLALCLSVSWLYYQTHSKKAGCNNLNVTPEMFTITRSNLSIGREKLDELGFIVVPDLLHVETAASLRKYFLSAGRESRSLFP